MRQTRKRQPDPETFAITAIAICLALAAFAISLQRGYILLYGDAVAHINIARRVFDSRTPGLLQLGTVWLPLLHLLMIPFIWPLSGWQSGAGGSVPSLVAYVFSVRGVFQLVRHALSSSAGPDRSARLPAWFAALIFAFNPSLLYLSTTAMTEPLYMALFIWAVVYFAKFMRAAKAESADQSLLEKFLYLCGYCLAAAELTRYDGWFAAAVIVTVAIGMLLGEHQGIRRPSLMKFLLLCSAVPIFWIAYNAAVYRNPLEFANGPYSARAIEQRSVRPGFPPHPGSHDLKAASQYFVKSAEDNLAEGFWQKPWLWIAFCGSLLVLFRNRGLSALLLLWVPLPFYALSIAYGGVPIFVPTWWPFSYYNVRYGIGLLPAVAVFVSVAIYYLGRGLRPKSAQFAVALVALACVVGSYQSAWRAQPVSFREAWVNSRSRIALERELASNIRKLPPGATLLMYLGDHVGALQDAGIPLSHVINEGNHRTWRQPSDPEGEWERALATPSSMADYAIGIDNDPVAHSARAHKLLAIAVIETPGQPSATIYYTGRR